MALHEFLATVVLVTASGALAPGPLFFSTLIHGSRLGAKAGVLASVGHTVVEFPLVLLIALGYLTLLSDPSFKVSIGALGGSAMLVFGALQLRPKALQQAGSPNTKFRSAGPLVTGIVTTALNPFFIAWWLTVGSPIIGRALILAAISGVAIMYAAHVWMDYALLSISAHLASRGRSLLRAKGYRVLVALFGVALIYFGASFLVDVFQFIAV